MQRVTRSTAVAVLPAPPAGAGSPGYFTGGDAGTGTSATVPGYEWFNMIQEEMMAVVLAAGLTPSSGDLTQLLEAIRFLVAVGTVPTGAMLPFPGTTAPPGWAKANGILVPRTGGWADLYAYAVASGNIVSDAAWLAGQPGSFSTGDGLTTFRIIERRGLFDRGYHDGSGAYESNTSLLLGAYRDSQNKAHTHMLSTRPEVQSGGSENPPLDAAGGVVDYPTASSGGVEAFPRHTTSLWCIKL